MGLFGNQKFVNPGPSRSATGRNFYSEEKLNKLTPVIHTSVTVTQQNLDDNHSASPNMAPTEAEDFKQFYQEAVSAKDIESPASRKARQAQSFVRPGGGRSGAARQVVKLKQDGLAEEHPVLFADGHSAEYEMSQKSAWNRSSPSVNSGSTEGASEKNKSGMKMFFKKLKGPQVGTPQYAKMPSITNRPYLDERNSQSVVTMSTSRTPPENMSMYSYNSNARGPPSPSIAGSSTRAGRNAHVSPSAVKTPTAPSIPLDKLAIMSEQLSKLETPEARKIFLDAYVMGLNQGQSPELGSDDLVERMAGTDISEPRRSSVVSSNYAQSQVAPSPIRETFATAQSTSAADEASHVPYLSSLSYDKLEMQLQRERSATQSTTAAAGKSASPPTRNALGGNW